MRVLLLLVASWLFSAASMTTAFVAPSVGIMPSHTATTTASSSPTTALQMTVLTYKGKKKNFKAGSPLSRAVAQLGVPVKYSCKK